MSGDISRESVGDATEGVPWQIIYTSFLGVTLCAFGIYAGMYLLHGTPGWKEIVLGVAVLVISLGVAASFVALLTGAGWALIVCRTFVILAVLALAVEVVYAVVRVVRSPEWQAPEAKLWRLVLDVTLEPTVLTPLVGVLVTAGMLWFLFGRPAKRFFSR